MSGIYIPGMEMPENCDDCDLMTVAGEYGEPTCPFGRIIRCASERHPDCPLIPVPEHGDLIERDEAVRDLRMDYAYAAARVVSLQPTIIPADHFRDATKMMEEEGAG